MKHALKKFGDLPGGPVYNLFMIYILREADSTLPLLSESTGPHPSKK